MEGIQGGDVIESKAITLLEPKHGSKVPMILTAIDQQDNEVLDDAGYRGRHVMIALIDGMIHDAFTDPYSSDHHMVEGRVQSFMMDVISGWKTHGEKGIKWTDIEDGEAYEVGDLQRLD